VSSDIVNSWCELTTGQSKKTSLLNN